MSILENSIEVLNGQIEELNNQIIDISAKITNISTDIKIVGERVIHKKYGLGIIIENNSGIVVKFENEYLAKFQFPSAFIQKFLVFENIKNMDFLNELNKLEESQKEIEKDIEAKKQEIERLKTEKKPHNFSSNEITMLTVSTGISFNDIMQHNIYCCKATSNFSKDIHYLALYSNKCINAIGKVNKIIKAKYVDNKWLTNLYYGNEAVTNNDIKQIDDLRTRGFDLFSCDIGNIEHYYFIIENFVLSNFVKTSNGPMQRIKYFNLCELLNISDMPNIDKLVSLINQKEW